MRGKLYQSKVTARRNLLEIPQSYFAEGIVIINSVYSVLASAIQENMPDIVSDKENTNL